MKSREEIPVEGAENKARVFIAIPELSLAPQPVSFMKGRQRPCAPTLRVLSNLLSGLEFMPFCTEGINLHHGHEEASGV